MAYNGSGSFSPNASYFPVVSGALIESAKYNGTVNDIASGLSTAITKDGQTTITANLPMSGYRHTGVSNGAARDDYAALGQVQDSASQWAGTAGGTANAITLTLTPSISAYAAGQSFTYKSGASANTTAMTVAVSGQAAKAIQKNGAAVASGDHPANMWFRITYDGAAFQLEQIAPISAAVTTAIALKASATSPTLTTPTITGATDMTGAVLTGGTPLTFEGATDNAFETSIVVTNPTADRTVTLPDANVDLTLVRDATTTLKGVTRFATDAEVLTGLVSTAAITPFGFSSGLSLAANGKYTLPGNIMIQWGSSGASVAGTGVTFPTPFPTACLCVTIGQSSVTAEHGVGSVTTSGFTFFAGATTTNNYWFALGY